MSEKRDGLFARAEEVLSLFRRGAEFTQDLLKENERLRQADRSLRGPEHGGRGRRAGRSCATSSIARIEELEGEKQDILDRLDQVERENHHFAGRYLEIEEENNNLANLYVARYQLHSTLDFERSSRSSSRSSST